MSDIVRLCLRAEESRMEGHAKGRRGRRWGSPDKSRQFRNKHSDGGYAHALFELEEVDGLVDSRIP
jgi:hypothetical protein